VKQDDTGNNLVDRITRSLFSIDKNDDLVKRGILKARGQFEFLESAFIDILPALNDGDSYS